jgi:hypothetical protein
MSVATPTAKNKNITALPTYFTAENADLSMLRQCFVNRSGDGTENITHMTSIPFHEVDDNNPEHFIDIKKQISLTHLRDISKVFKKTRPPTKDIAYQQINAIAKLTITMDELDELASSKKKCDDVTNGKMLMRLIGVLFGPICVHYFSQLNDRKRVVDFERGRGRNDDAFYAQVSDAVNDNQNDQHKFLHKCSNPIDAVEYTSYICDENTNADDHPSGDVVIQTNTSSIRQAVLHLCKVRNKMVALMSLSGNGDNNPMSFVVRSIKSCKVGTSITKIAAYYFFMQCKFHKKVSSGITNTLPEYMSTGMLCVVLNVAA